MSTVRQARAEDHDDVAAFARGTWPDREATDYVPEVFPEWVATDGPRQHTAVVEVDGRVVACCQASLLTDEEAWLQGIRVDPDHRGAGHGTAVGEYLVEWCREGGAAVVRNLVFDWNPPGMGQSRATGFGAVADPQFVRVDADGDAADTGPGAAGPAWHHWTASDARGALTGLALDPDEPWAFSELTRGDLEAARPLALVDDGTRAMTVRIGTRDPDYREPVVADYAVAAWEPGAGRALFDVIRADAAAAGAGEARVVVAGTPRHVAGAGAARAAFDQGGLVFARDLSRR